LRRKPADDLGGLFHAPQNTIMQLHVPRFEFQVKKELACNTAEVRLGTSEVFAIDCAA
jgi:hypothetical protein